MSSKRPLWFRLIPSFPGGRRVFFANGTCRPAPGGGVEMTMSVNGSRTVVVQPTGSAEEAMWRAVVMAAGEAGRVGARAMIVRTRSNHVKKQVRGVWQPGALKPWYDSFQTTPYAQTTIFI